LDGLKIKGLDESSALVDVLFGEVKLHFFARIQPCSVGKNWHENNKNGQIKARKVPSRSI